MNIEEVKAAKAAAEKRIAEAITKEISGFMAATSVAPSSISIHTNTLQRPDEAGRMQTERLIVLGVELEVRL